MKNRAPAAVQITAEQIIKEAQYYQVKEKAPSVPHVQTSDELADYRYMVYHHGGGDG